MTSTDTGFTRTPAGARPAPLSLLSQGADSSGHQAEAAGTGPSRNLRHQSRTERMDLRRKPGPPTALPFSRFIFLTCSSAHTCVSLAGTEARVDARRPPSLGTFPVLAGCHPRPRPGLYEAGKVFFCGSVASLKNDFLASRKGLNIAQA